MPYISLDNLTQYNGRLRDYIDSSFDKLDGANWRKTSAGQSVTCYPIPETALEPEVTFKFSEVPPESGTKGPDNPSTIVGVESVSCNVCESEGVDDTPYSIDLGGTYYGGTVNLATGVMTETVFHGVFDDPYGYIETLTDSTYVCLQQTKASYPLHGANADANISCNMFATAGTGEKIALRGGAGAGAVALFMLRSELDVSNAVDPSSPTSAEWVAAFQAWRQQQAQEIEFTYTMNTPVVHQLTPVLVRSLPALSHYVPRQNTIYTPHESVQVGYAKSASKTSQDLANAIVALGGNV